MIRRTLLLLLLTLGLLPAAPDKKPDKPKSNAPAKPAPAKPAPSKPAPAKPAPTKPVPPPAVAEIPEGYIPSPPPTPTLGPAGVPPPPYPKWEEDDLVALNDGSLVPGAFLLTGDMPPDNALKLEPLKVDGPTAEDLAGNQPPATDIPEKYLVEYFKERPKSFLVDPQHLLTPEQYQARQAFLDQHATESTIDLFIYIFAGTQELPGGVRAEELAERLFSTGRPAAFVYYFLGAPQRSVLYLTPSLTDVLSTAEQKRALQSSVGKADEKADPVEQLEAFETQMSIRLYWLERILSGTNPVETVRPVETPLAKGPDPAAKVAGALNKLPDRWWIPAGVLLGSALAGAAVRIWLQFKARCRFPEFDVEPRLGGDHAAGIGAVISFASASLPPAVQREQVPDYLRRA